MWLRRSWVLTVTSGLVVPPVGCWVPAGCVPVGCAMMYSDNLDQWRTRLFYELRFVRLFTRCFRNECSRDNITSISWRLTWWVEFPRGRQLTGVFRRLIGCIVGTVLLKRWGGAGAYYLRLRHTRQATSPLSRCSLDKPIQGWDHPDTNWDLEFVKWVNSINLFAFK